MMHTTSNMYIYYYGVYNVYQLLVWCIYIYRSCNWLSGFVPSGLHECGVDNRGCSEGAVCLVETGVRGACVCSPLEASARETDSDGISRITCAGESITGKKGGKIGEESGYALCSVHVLYC